MKFFKSLIITTLFLTAFQAQGSIALRGKDFSPQAAHRTTSQQGIELNLNRKFVKSGRKSIDAKDIAQVIPLNLSATSNGDYVKEEIMKKTASTIMKSPMIQNSFLAKSMKKAQKATKVEMSIKAKPKKVATKKKAARPSPADAIVVAQPTEHKFNFNVEALKTEAKITYQGFVKSQVRYNHADAALNVSLEEALSQNSKIALTHQSDRLGSQQMVNFQMNW